MADTAAHLVDRVFADAPVRQWVLSLPFELRFLLARDPELCSKVRRIYVRAIFGLQKRQAKQLGIDFENEAHSPAQIVVFHGGNQALG